MKLFLVATPIGNLADISQRAVTTLETVDLILAEDTRKTGLLLKHLGIGKPMLSLHEHNEIAQIPHIVARLKEGKTIALVSDAGTPMISDPGFKLVREAIAQSVEVIPIPGPSAVLAALSASGLPTDHFFFVGYLPKTTGKAEMILENLAEFTQKLPTSLVFFESPHRILKTLDLLEKHFPSASLAVGRELTKIHEEFRRGSISEIKSDLKSRSAKGEFTLVLRQ
jgi:16S rRNA (cytidine1402-2'-O)-methyltransferase